MVISWESAGDLASRVAGAGVVAVALVDVFHTVLFPGSGHGPVRRLVGRLVRAAFGPTQRLPDRQRRRLLSYAGPVEVAATLASWFALLLVGWAAVYRPALGDGVVAATGATDRSWGTALYFSGYNLTTLGLGDVVADSPAYRVLVVLEAATGFMVLTLAISYFVSVYSTLTSRNTFALSLHDRSRGTGRGSVVVRALWEEGPVAAALHLDTMASGLRHVAQTHTAYPVLRTFHYQHAYDALPQMLLTCLETATLLRTTVDAGGEGRCELRGSAVAEIEAAAATLVRRVVATPDDHGPPPPATLAAWRRHHADVLADLGPVPVRPGSVEDYVDARRQWDGPLGELARNLLYPWPEQD